MRSTSSEQRRRGFFGFAGSHSPQSPPMRGTPADEPQPRMVARSRAHHAAARANSRSKFAEVSAANSAGSSPRCPAMIRAVSAA